jgi:hypothetical protein
MKTPVVVVSAALTVAILLAASLVIVTGTRGEDGAAPPANPDGASRPFVKDEERASAISANTRP